MWKIDRCQKTFAVSYMYQYERQLNIKMEVKEEWCLLGCYAVWLS
jgi:hypothetical protein